MAKAIGTLGNVDSLTMAGYTFVDIANLKVLVAATATTGNVSTFRTGGSSGYQVTAAKTLTLRAARITVASVTAAAASLIDLFYADNDVAIDTTTARTNQVNYNGATGTNYRVATWSALANSVEAIVNFPVAAQKYPGFIHEIAQNVHVSVCVVGYEA